MRLWSPGGRLVLALAAAGGLVLAAPYLRAHADDGEGAPFDASVMNRSANACTNFFDYATGAWRKAHPIPAAYSEYGYIEALVDRTRTIVRGVLEDAQRQPGDEGSTTQKIGAFYGSCMDTAGIERAGLQPLAPELARIDAIRSRDALAGELGRLARLGVDAGFSVGSAQDYRDSSRVIGEIDQGGLGLPERDYYLRADAESASMRTKYRAHVARMLALSGDRSAAVDAAAILAFETTLARGSLPAAELRDPLATYHPTALTKIAASLPHLSVATYLAQAGAPAAPTFNLAEPSFVRTVDRAVAGVPLSTWRPYLRWRLLDTFGAALPARFERESFRFHGQLLGGAKEQLPRWKRCVNATNALLGEAVGEAYVAKAFSAADKAAALTMTKRTRAAYRAEMERLAWMTPATKRYAVAKLEAMNLKVGYPDRWRSYARFVVTNGPYAGNVVRGNAFQRAYDLAKIGKPVNRAEWFMTPQTVNAYNDTQRNEIVLPAAQLQKPFFDAQADDAANLGATGAGTVGHEMTHGFDDQGHKFDLHGNLRNWWTAADLKQFDARAGCVIAQFDRSIAVGSVHYQGKLVAGEAIADLGGVMIGYRALEDSLGTGPREKTDGFTPEQRYFLAYAQSWTEEMRPEAMRTLALGNPHPIPRDRVNLTLQNVPAWYDAFSCPRPKRPICDVW